MHVTVYPVLEFTLKNATVLANRICFIIFESTLKKTQVQYVQYCEYGCK